MPIREWIGVFGDSDGKVTKDEFSSALKAAAE
jgi:hypothetical protein